MYVDIFLRRSLKVNRLKMDIPSQWIYNVSRRIVINYVYIKNRQSTALATYQSGNDDDKITPTNLLLEFNAKKLLYL